MHRDDKIYTLDAVVDEWVGSYYYSYYCVSIEHVNDVISKCH